MTTWRNLILEEMNRCCDSWRELAGCTLSEEELDNRFDHLAPEPIGQPFTLWTFSRVYFPWEHDGVEKCASVPRSPCSEVTPHIGGTLYDR